MGISTSRTRTCPDRIAMQNVNTVRPRTDMAIYLPLDDPAIEEACNERLHNVHVDICMRAQTGHGACQLGSGEAKRTIVLWRLKAGRARELSQKSRAGAFPELVVDLSRCS